MDKLDLDLYLDADPDPHSEILLDPDPHSEKLLDPDSHKVNADPQPLLALLGYTVSLGRSGHGCQFPPRI